MAASRDIPTHRSSSQHRQVLGLAASSLPSRQSYLRTHSHSVSNGSTNPSNRINRRKSSVQVNQANAAALAAAAKEGTPAGLDMGRGQADGVAVPQSPKDKILSGSIGNNGSALVDGPPLSSMLGSAKASSKSRTRRASEGSRITKERSKSAVGELRCETCGKGYKHGSCLTKHLWEHTPEWALTSKLLISKHQQVQLLEAASVLLQMNQEMPTTAPHAAQADDEHSSASPAASGSSDLIDGDDVSSRTSTPSQDESSKSTLFRRRDRLDSFAEPFAHSYQSSSAFGASVPNDGHGVPMYRQWSSSFRPSNIEDQSDEEQIDVKRSGYGLVNGSFGTPNLGRGQLESDIPPVPPVPAKFVRSDPSIDVEMVDEDDDDGVFGHMEQ